MSQTTNTLDSCEEVISGWWHRRGITKALLVAGIVGVLVYALGDLMSGLLYDGYSFKDQAISELSAFGSPVRPLMVTAILVQALLGGLLAVGLWRAADRTSLRWVSGLLLASALLGIPTHTIFAMSSRGMELGGANDVGHIILTNVFTVLITAAIVLSAVAYRGWFRIYASATLAILIGFGAAAWIAMQGIEKNVTPWVGGFERINAYAMLAWMIVLAVTVMRRNLGTGTADPDGQAIEARTPVVTADPLALTGSR